MSVYSNPVLRLITEEEDRQISMQLSITVFVNEQKYPLERIVDDEYNDNSDVWIAYCEKKMEDGTVQNDVPVGTVRYIDISEDVCRLGRLVVLSEARGLSLGRKLVDIVIQEAANRGKTTMFIHAQANKRGFYEKFGFVVEEGDDTIFHVDGDPHYRMWIRNIGKK
ncbi:acyl-CoA N-acyltransferase [Absidia repens]|uniref:Glucosamine 6-phosphate N-acetyltransferase n=1 Tax=Absidia repens TaxID=90262 RepID=A0A1X2IWZ3_9FUNG|nr:acyl-CoA N-acyltransferase [Absidia repens]